MKKRKKRKNSHPSVFLFLVLPVLLSFLLHLIVFILLGINLKVKSLSHANPIQKIQQPVQAYIYSPPPSVPISSEPSSKQLFNQSPKKNAKQTSKQSPQQYHSTTNHPPSFSKKDWISPPKLAQSSNPKIVLHSAQSKKINKQKDPRKNTALTQNRRNNQGRKKKRVKGEELNINPSSSYSVLHLFLYDLIQSRLHYPKEVALTQPKRTILQFTLLPNGQIQNIKILKSSEHRILDQAAIEAVSRISPVNLSKLQKRITPPSSTRLSKTYSTQHSKEGSFKKISQKSSKESSKELLKQKTLFKIEIIFL